MNEQIFWKGISELIVAILIGVTLLYMTYKIMDRFIQNKYKMGIDNTSYAIFSGSVLFSVAYMITGIKAPILNSLKLLQLEAGYDGSPIFDAITGLLQAIACATVYENDSYISEATITTSASA